MAMFDTIYWDFRPPGFESLLIGEFQTKSLDRKLQEYRVLTDGKLWVKTRADGDPDPIESDTPFYWVNLKFCGTLNFHNGSVAFSAGFESGQVVSLSQCVARA